MSTKTPAWENFLKSVFDGDKKKIRALQLFSGRRISQSGVPGTACNIHAAADKPVKNTRAFNPELGKKLP